MKFSGAECRVESRRQGERVAQADTRRRDGAARTASIPTAAASAISTVVVLQQLTLNAAEFVVHLDHVHRDADGVRLVGHRTDQAQVAFVDEAEECHATALSACQRHAQTQIRFQQMVFARSPSRQIHAISGKVILVAGDKIPENQPAATALITRAVGTES